LHRLRGRAGLGRSPDPAIESGWARAEASEFLKRRRSIIVPHCQAGREGAISPDKDRGRLTRKRIHQREERRMRLFRVLASILALWAGPSAAFAQTNSPDRPIKMIVPLAAASAVDVAARIVTQKMADNMGQQFVILNMPGASGLIGAEQVAHADPDGYTIGGFNDSIMTMVPNLQAKMRWDILRDFE